MLEAIGIPHAATVDDEEVYERILLDRIINVRVMLDSILDPADLPDLGTMQWRVAYLRDRLAECPATGYKTWDEVRAEQAAARMAEVPLPERCAECRATDVPLISGERGQVLCADPAACAARQDGAHCQSCSKAEA